MTPPPLDLEERRRRWLEAAVWGPFRKALDTGKESRNGTLNAAAFALGCWVGGGVISGQEAEAALEKAAADLVGPGFSAAEARYTCRRALKQGEGHPRPWPEELDPLRGGALPRPAARRPAAPPAPKKPIPYPRPPAAEVAELWLCSLAPTAATPEAEACAAWLRSRGLDPAEVARLDLARALPPASGEVADLADELAAERLDEAAQHGGNPREALAEAAREARRRDPRAVVRVLALLPGWARMSRRNWRESGHLLLVQGWSAAGEAESLHARLVLPGEAEHKSAWPAAGPGTASGLVFGNPAARRLLAGQGEGEPPGVVIAEGIPDWLTACLAWPALAVFGMASGGWQNEHADRIPDGSRVAVWTDADPTGEMYFDRIAKSFAGRRVKLLRGKGKVKA